MNDTPASERPVAITIICILGFIGAALTIPLIFSDIAKVSEPGIHLIWLSAP